jgi:hypothetical protein
MQQGLEIELKLLGSEHPSSGQPPGRGVHVPKSGCFVPELEEFTKRFYSTLKRIKNNKLDSAFLMCCILLS